MDGPQVSGEQARFGDLVEDTVVFCSEVGDLAYVGCRRLPGNTQACLEGTARSEKAAASDAGQPVQVSWSSTAAREA